MLGIGSFLSSGLASIGFKAICMIYCQGVKPILAEHVKETSNEWDDAVYQILNRVFGCESEGGE